MRCLLAVFFALALAGVAAAQATPDRRLITVREFVVKVDCKERPAYRALWVSRDGAKSWKPCREMGVVETWGEWAGGVLRCSVRVPEDGTYDLHAQLGDALSNRGTEPEAGKPGDPRLRLEIREPLKVAHLEWAEPRGTVEWLGGQSVTLKWSAAEGEFRERSAEVAYSVEGGPWIRITKGLEATGSYPWVVPNRATRELRLRVTAATKAGLETAAETEGMNVRATQRPNIVQARALYDRARVLHAQQRATEARLKYQEALAAWPEFGEVHNDLGKLCAEQREPAKALEYFLRARRTCPSDPVPAVNAARMELELGLLEDALADLREAIALGVDGDERTSVLAGETLWSAARAATLAKDEARSREACELLLRIRQAAAPTKAKAEQMIDWLKSGGRQ